MLPTTYQIPAALLLLVGGLLACFAGYRLFRLVLGIYGFILGSLFATSLVSTPGLLWTAIVGLVGGLIGALLLTIGYFVGVALLGGTLGVVMVHAIWAQQGWGDPRALALFGFAIGGGVIALVFQRYVIIVGTAFGGAWTAAMGAAAMFSDSAVRQLADGRNIWFIHPLTPPLTEPWVAVAWLVLGIAGLVVQLRAGIKGNPSGS